MVGIDSEEYQHIKWPVSGKLNEVGMTVPGFCENYGKVQIWDQDNSIMSFTAGYLISNAHNLAKFYWDLLGPEKKLVS